MQKLHVLLAEDDMPKKLKPFLLYHWSPVSRRKQILRHGLRIGCRVVQHSKGWRPTYLCFSDSPSLAWGLCGALSKTEGAWDLWMIWSSELETLWRLPRPAPPYYVKRPTEWRTKHPVPKRSLWHVATRHHKPRKPCKISSTSSSPRRPRSPS